MRRWLLTAAGLGLTAGVLVPACDDDETAPTPSGNCSLPADCPAANRDCVGLVDNAGKDKFALRMAQLTVTSPPSLATQVMYGVISVGVNINLPDQCNVRGGGSFNWLMEFDTNTGMARTGGALPQHDPFDGYCFLDPSTGFGPMEVYAPLGANGSFEAGPFDYLRVPIFLSMDDPDDYVEMPLHQLTLRNGIISEDQNCVGRYNAEGLKPLNNCLPDFTDGIEYFVNDAEMDGFIELEEADEIIVDIIGHSLCVVLSGDPNAWGEEAADGKRYCKRDAADQIAFQGDWCSDNTPDGCTDSVRVTAEFAASAVELRTDCPSGTGGAAGAGGGGGAGGSGGGSGGSAAGAGGAAAAGGAAGAGGQ